MNTEPMAEYLQAIEAFKAGHEGKSLELLAKSIGAQDPTAYMADCLPQLTKPNAAILTLLVDQIRGGSRG